MSIAAESVFRRVFRVSHELPDENKVAFFDESRSELVVVNALGGAIWNLLDGRTSVGEICELLASEVRDAPDEHQVKEQVDAFLHSLLERRAIELVGEAQC